jgi:hypothetical protein
LTPPTIDRIIPTREGHAAAGGCVTIPILGAPVPVLDDPNGPEIKIVDEPLSVRDQWDAIVVFP